MNGGILMVIYFLKFCVMFVVSLLYIFIIKFWFLGIGFVYVVKLINFIESG